MPIRRLGARAMGGMLSDGMRRSLQALRAAGEPVPAVDLARRLLALDGPVPFGLARHLVARILGAEAEALPEPLPVERLRPPEERSVAAVSLEEASFAVVDLETSGLSSERHSIIEIGAVRVRRLQIVSAFETFVLPRGRAPLSEAIVTLTGIDDAMLRNAPPPSRALADFAAWLEAAPNAPWVAHNAAFDDRFLRRAFEAETGRVPDVAVLCTRKLGRRLLPRLGRYDLDHLCAHFGISNRARHRALGDAEATARLWLELLGIARRDGVATLGGLFDLQSRPLRRRRRRRGRT